MKTQKRRFLSFILILSLLMVINSGFTVVDMDAITFNNEVEDPSQYFKMRESDIEKHLYTMVRNPDTKQMELKVIGDVRINHNESEFLIYIEPKEDEGWQIAELRAYVGHDPIPLSEDLKPVTALFPFKQSYPKPVGSQLITIDLYEDLGLTWLPKDADKLLQNVAVYCKVKGIGAKGETLNLNAWVGKVIPADENEDGIIDEEEGALDKTFLADLSSGTYFTVEVTDKIFRKNVSKMPETETTKAKIELLPVYVPARRANGEYVQLEYNSYDDPDAETPVLTTEIRTECKPLVSVFAEEVAGCEIPPIYGDEWSLARDVYVAISRDEGNTWKRTNLSRSADRSSFELENGLEYLGDTHKPNIKIQGNTFLIAWTSKYARSGTPTYAISEFLKYQGEVVLDESGNPIPNPAYTYYEEDIWGVSGPQRSKNYEDEIGIDVEIPFSVVWVNRGFIDPETGDITLFKAERLTSGRRDAAQITIASSSAGYGIVWQEDPDGLRAGEMAGPGDGWSGATTNHKTDIWYSYISIGDFKLIDEDYVSNGDPQYDEEDPTKGDGRDKALVPMKLPIRLTDNEVLNTDTMKIDPTKLKPDSASGEGFWTLDLDDLPYLDADGIPVNVAPPEEDEEDNGNNPLGSHTYGYKLKGLLWDDTQEYIRFYETVNHQGVTKYIAITVDGRLMDGDTGASRGNLMMQGKYAVLGYEETKGAGSGPPEHDEDKVPEDGTGNDAYVPELGKNVIYHFFDYNKPVKVAGGEILNPQEVDENGELVFLVDELGAPIVDYLGNPVPAYENARRPRFLIQGLDAAQKSKNKTSMVTLYKMGEDGKGRPSDIIMQRWDISNYDSTNHPNPYDTFYLEKDTGDLDGYLGEYRYQNISSVTVDEVETYTNDSGETRYKLLRWSQTAENLDDQTTVPFTEEGQEGWDNDDARAHRGFLRGDFLAVAYTWTPNWTAARNGNDVYNLYIRRSFTGGKTWTTLPASMGGTGITATQIYRHESTYTGEDDMHYEVEYTVAAGAFEPARNVSLLRNNKETVIEPRLVGVPGTTLTDGVAKYPEDTSDPKSFWVTYGTHANIDTNIPKDYDGEVEEGGPLDLYYSYSTDRGETYYTIDKQINPDSDGNNAGEWVTVWDWLAKDTGKLKMEQAECQIRMTPDGSRFYAVWNESGIDLRTGEYSSDVMFRRIDRDHGFIVSNPIPTSTP